MKQRAMRETLPAVFLALLFALGCAAPPESEQGAEPSRQDSQLGPMTLEEARARIDSTIGDAQASTLSECALAALGVRPCGGPRAYLAYSTAETDSAALAVLLGVYERLDRERNEAQGLVSTCELMLPPDLALENGRCVTR